MTFLIALTAIVIATLGLGAYVTGLFYFGVWAGKRHPERWPIFVGLCAIGFVFVPVAMLGMLLPLNQTLSAAVSICLYLLHAPAMAVGYWGGRTERHDAEVKRWNKNVDDWLGEWECHPVQEQPDEPSS